MYLCQFFVIGGQADIKFINEIVALHGKYIERWYQRRKSYPKTDRSHPSEIGISLSSCLEKPGLFSVSINSFSNRKFWRRCRCLDILTLLFFCPMRLFRCFSSSLVLDFVAYFKCCYFHVIFIGNSFRKISPFSIFYIETNILDWNLLFLSYLYISPLNHACLYIFQIGLIVLCTNSRIIMFFCFRSLTVVKRTTDHWQNFITSKLTIIATQNSSL